MTRPALVAIDLGAESCRVSLLRWSNESPDRTRYPLSDVASEDLNGHGFSRAAPPRQSSAASAAEGIPSITMVHRFANGPWSSPAHSGIRWNLDRICQELERGLHSSAELAPEGIASIGVTGWAVDYVRLSPDNQPLAPPFCYRDPRNMAAAEAVHARIPTAELYARTGVQIQPINTLYQLYADKLAGTEDAAPWVNLPEYILLWLGAPRIAEYTNATHTGLVDAATRSWSPEIFSILGLDPGAAPPLVAPGTALGSLREDLRRLPAFRNTQLIAPACHDTASAIAGIPDLSGTDKAAGDWAYISSGTWSLIGMVLPETHRTPQAGRDGFTNLGAAGGGVLFHRGLAGMWLLRQCLDTWQTSQRGWALDELVAATRSLPPPDALLDLDDPAFVPPGDMPARINAQRARSGFPPLPDGCDAAPDYANVIFHSLAARYGALLGEIARITGRPPRRICVVGGGSRNEYLNELTAQAAGVPVERCSVESSTLGNFAVQLARLEQGTDGVSAEEIARQAQLLADIAD